MREVVYPNYSIRFDDSPGRGGKPKHEYLIDGEKVPSVTGIVDQTVAIPFGVPAWYGQRIGVEGIQRLYNTLPFEDFNATLQVAPPEELVSLLTQHELTVNHQRDKAGARGTAVHHAAQRFAEFGEEIDPLSFPEEEMGYVLALKNWLDEANPSILDAEQIVGSKRLGYAGTLDLRAEIAGRVGIIDYKTTTGIRVPSVDYQLAMYELASHDCGYPPTDFRAILRLDEDGTWEWYESTTLLSEIEHLLAVWDERKRIEATPEVKALRAAERARKKAKKA